MDTYGMVLPAFCQACDLPSGVSETALQGETNLLTYGTLLLIHSGDLHSFASLDTLTKDVFNKTKGRIKMVGHLNNTRCQHKDNLPW